jgi:hypothetical protein
MLTRCPFDVKEEIKETVDSFLGRDCELFSPSSGSAQFPEFGKVIGRASVSDFKTAFLSGFLEEDSDDFCFGFFHFFFFTITSSSFKARGVVHSYLTRNIPQNVFTKSCFLRSASRHTDFM